MASVPAILQGVVHGKMIELDREPGLSDGQRVIVTVQAAPPPQAPLPPGEGIHRSAGAWEEDAAELDQYLEWNRQQRKLGRPRIGP